MLDLLRSARAEAFRNLEKDRSMEGRLKVLSRFIWPWDVQLLVPLVALLAASDLISTYVLLELSGKASAYESGLLASWALRRGGFNGLYIMDAVAVGLLCVMAFSARIFYGRFGLIGYARAAYVALLVPYALASAAAIVNNLVLTVR